MNENFFPALALVNGRDGAGRAICVRLAGDRIVEIDAEPRSDDLVVDLKGDRLLPGLINAHDHLQLNHFPSLDYRNDYRNVSEWIADIQLRRQDDRSVQAASAIELRERLLLGGIKNLLSGVTCVAHHDPWYEPLRGDDFPVRTVRRYGWSHSLLIDGEEQVRDAYSATPDDAPWIIHAAEGVDAAAADEFRRLRGLDCIGAKTLIVHGIAMSRRELLELTQRGGGLIWCPVSNLRLFGRTAEVDQALQRGRVALGTDSRLSGSRDLLTELRVAREHASLNESTLEALVTVNAARLLRLRDYGALLPGYAADVTVLARDAMLAAATRSDVRLVISRGRPLYGDATYLQSLAPGQWSSIRVDGHSKALRSSLVDALRAHGACEPGLELTDLAWKVA